MKINPFFLICFVSSFFLRFIGEFLAVDTFCKLEPLELCRWHPLRGGPCDDFHRLFWNPPLPEEVFVSSSSRPQDR